MAKSKNFFFVQLQIACSSLQSLTHQQHINNNTQIPTYLNVRTHLYVLRRLTVTVDPKGEGDYLPCVEIPDIGLSEGWGRKAYVGLSAATGQLSGEMT